MWSPQLIVNMRDDASLDFPTWFLLGVGVVPSYRTRKELYIGRPGRCLRIIVTPNFEGTLIGTPE